MSLHIVDDEQRSDRRANPHAPFGFRPGGDICFVGATRRCATTSPASRRLASAPAGQERGLFYYSDRLLGIWDCRSKETVYCPKLFAAMVIYPTPSSCC